MKHNKELMLSLSCFLFALLLTMIWIRQRDENLASRVSPEILRFHVLANSNSNDDQQLKLEVKSLLIDTIWQQLPADAGKQETCDFIEEHRADLEDAAEAYMKKAGYDYPVKLELAASYFPTKAYGDVVFPSGTYDAAKVTIGDGRGRNWWCVLYPQLCFVNASYGVMPDSSKEELHRLLPEDDYEGLLSDSAARAQMKVSFKLLEFLR